MCLVKMKVEHEDETPSPPRRIVVRPVSHLSADRIIVARTSSRPISRSHSHRSSHRSSRLISVIEPAPAPRPSQYVIAAASYPPTAAAGARSSIPRIIHAAPSPPRSPRISTSPRVSHTSVHSSHSRHNSISGGGGARGSPRGSRTRVVLDGEIVYVSTERERGGTEMRRRSTRERPRSTGQFLTASTAAMAASGAGSGGRREDIVDSLGYIEPSRQTMFLEDRGGGGGDGPSRTRSRSITYATTGPRLSRERVLVEEGGRRREGYQVMGGR